MEKDFYDYIFNNRISGFTHPTREKVISLFYELRDTRRRLTKPADYLFKQLDGNPGIFFTDNITNLRYTLLNCCFYYCEFLLNSRVEHEPVYNSSDYFINKISEVNTEAEAHALLSNMAEAFIELSERPEKGPYCSIVETCIRYINHELYGRLLLRDIARHLNITPQYLTTLFKKETGSSIYEFIQKRKIEEAKIMLRQTSNSVTIIADALGYSSTAHFSNVFKSMTSQTPLQYRNNTES